MVQLHLVEVDPFVTARLAGQCHTGPQGSPVPADGKVVLYELGCLSINQNHINYPVNDQSRDITHISSVT
jgi:hypothetical protein